MLQVTMSILRPRLVLPGFLGTFAGAFLALAPAPSLAGARGLRASHAQHAVTSSRVQVSHGVEVLKGCGFDPPPPPPPRRPPPAARRPGPSAGARLPRPAARDLRGRRARDRDRPAGRGHHHRMTLRFTYAESMCDPGQLLPLAVAAEQAGFSSFTVPDSIAYPQRSAREYPYTADGNRAFLEDKPFLEPFSLIPALGAVTERLRFTTFVVKLPIRQPVLVAKSAASVAVLTDNRLAPRGGGRPRARGH